MHRDGRWIEMPVFPRGKHHVKNQFLTKIEQMNEHVGKMQLDPDYAQFIDTHVMHMAARRDGCYTEPDVFVRATGPSFLHSQSRALRCGPNAIPRGK